MNQENVYEDEQEEGLTFKKIGRFLQKAWLRMLIYIAIAVLLATAVAVPIRMYYKSEPIAQTTIEYIYSGIEVGEDPSGAPLNTDNIISTTVLAKAVDEANLGGKIKDISTLRDAMRIESVLTDEYVRLTEAAANGDTNAANTLRNYNMYPTRFNIIISNPSAIGLSDDQAKLLLNKVVNCYYAEFQARFSVTTMFAENSYNLSENDQLEFTDVYDIYLQSLESVKAFLARMETEAAGFISAANDTTFAQLASDINVLSSSYNQFNAYILSNNIWRNRETARNALLASEMDINNRLEPLREYIKVLTEQIKNIHPNTTTTGAGTDSNPTTTIISYPPQYFTYQERLDEANRQVRDYEVQLKNIATRLNNLDDEKPTDDALKAKAVENLAGIEKQTVEVIKKVNATVADYYDTTFVSSSVRQTQAPVVTRRGISFSLLVVYAVTVIVAVLAAGIVTAVKMSRAKPTTEKVEDKKEEAKE
ncbi:MAG: hypothetical protein K2O04_04830 [Clostridiales bacterium]|nr:hypothetical protein [Clostridiales bacterium]